MASVERGGVASFYANGQLIEVAAEMDIKLGGLVRTPSTSSNGVAGYTTKWEAPEFTVEAIDGPGVSITALKAVTGTVQVILNNGKKYQLYNSFQIDDPSIKTSEGKASGVKFSGSRAQEI